MRYLAADFGPAGVRVNAISAGPIRTLAGAGIADARFMFNFQRDHSPLRRTVDDRGCRRRGALPVVGPVVGRHRRNPFRRRGLQHHFDAPPRGHQDCGKRRNGDRRRIAGMALRPDYGNFFVKRRDLGSATAAERNAMSRIDHTARRPSEAPPAFFAPPRAFAARRLAGFPLLRRRWPSRTPSPNPRKESAGARAFRLFRRQTLAAGASARGFSRQVFRSRVQRRGL